MPGPGTHADSGLRCAVNHGRGAAPCIVCECGEQVRPDRWAAHLAPAASPTPTLAGTAALLREVARAFGESRRPVPEQDLARRCEAAAGYLDGVATFTSADVDMLGRRRPILQRIAQDHPGDGRADDAHAAF